MWSFMFTSKNERGAKIYFSSYEMYDKTANKANYYIT